MKQDDGHFRLSAEDIHEIHEAAVVLNLASARDVLLSGIDPHTVASLNAQLGPSASILNDLHMLNWTGKIGDERPLEVWLVNAKSLAGRRSEGLVFDHALTALRQRGITRTAHRLNASAAQNKGSFRIVLTSLVLATAFSTMVGVIRGIEDGPSKKAPPIPTVTPSHVPPPPSATTPPKNDWKTEPLVVDKVVETPIIDGQRYTVTIDVNEGRAAYEFFVLNKEYDWAYGESKTAQLNGQGRDIYKEYVQSDGFRDAARCSLGLVGVGVASEEGPPAEELKRAFDRASQLVSWFQQVSTGQAFLPKYQLVLGKYANTGARLEDKGEKTRWQRKVIIISIIAEKGGEDHHEGAYQALKRIERYLRPAELSKYSLFGEKFRWIESSGGAGKRTALPQDCPKYVFQ